VRRKIVRRRDKEEELPVDVRRRGGARVGSARHEDLVSKDVGKVQWREQGLPET